jgi:DNA-binding GntR family transcriptional regulator
MEKKTVLLHQGHEGPLDAVELAYVTLRTNVLDGTLPPGSVLSQVTLARDLGISRTPLREALRQLASEGLVVGDFNQRLRVTELDLDDFDQIYACRIALEPIAIKSTVPYLEASHREILTSHVAGMDQAMAAPDMTSFRSHHRAFHLGLAGLAGSRIRRTLADLWDHSERYRLSYLHVDQAHPNDASGERLAVSQVEHRGMLDAALAGDADLCASLLIEHLRRTIENVFDEQSKPPSPRVARIAIASSQTEHTPER